MNLFSKTAVALAIAATAGSASATVISFDNLAGLQGSTFTSYVESGFTVESLLGKWLVAKNYGAPVPDIFSGKGWGTASASIEVTGGMFTFGSVDLSANLGNASYTFEGSLGGVSQFTQSGVRSCGGCNGLFATIGSSFSSVVIDSLKISITGLGSSYNVDNINVTAQVVPEPATYGLMLAGLLAVGTIARRRRTS
ncbi:MAG: VPLPA-CTERM sorting domain-containing protein [Burkholderiaceae bacterium]|nr:VPLPA-CTERM sorting domain-containing protein [Burkholderiaceae bacterium]MBT9504354.1 VPLPA-CTERM sorting domain-containing protein [Burkholderiaceae bacterium]